jgi:ABC-type transporter Mla subunit MlaD
MHIEDERSIPKLSTAKISTAGLVGDAFLEIVPSGSAEQVKRTSDLAQAERLESSPIPDISQLMSRIDKFGEELTVLTININDIIGDAAFRDNIKRLATNLEGMTAHADQILSRSQNIVNNTETATRNIADLSSDLRERLNQLSTKLQETMETISVKTAGVADQAATLADRLHDAAVNLDGGISDARRAINAGIGNPELAANLNAGIANIRTITDAVAGRSHNFQEIIDNLGAVSENLRGVSGRLGDIAMAVEPDAVAGAVNQLAAAIAAVTDVVDKITAEPVLALSVNKAADRIVKLKFDEMSRQPQFRSADALLDEINRWVREALRRGRLIDPAFEQPDERPYLVAP